MRTPLPMPATAVVSIETATTMAVPCGSIRDAAPPRPVVLLFVAWLVCCCFLGIFGKRRRSEQNSVLSKKYVCIQYLGKKYVCIHASQSRATYVGSTKSLQVPCKFPASSLHLRASPYPIYLQHTALPKNLQRGCTWYKIHEFLRGRLQRICNAEKSATRMHRRCSELAANLLGTCRELAGNLQTSFDKFPYNIWELVGMGQE